jgi:flagellar basal-body rod protein FlgB
MLANMTGGLDFHAKALVLRAERQRVIAGNIANADTPGYAARDFNFSQALSDATGPSSNASHTPNRSPQAAAHNRHIPLSNAAEGSNNPQRLAYTVQSQPSLDGNSVDMDRERANFMDNAIRYESTLRFINGHAKTILSAIQGQ